MLREGIYNLVAPIIKPWFIAGSIWLGAGLILVIIGLWFVLEGITYYEQQPQITPVIRTWTAHHAVLAVIVGLALIAAASAAFTHFILDVPRVASLIRYITHGVI